MARTLTIRKRTVITDDNGLIKADMGPVPGGIYRGRALGQPLGLGTVALADAVRKAEEILAAAEVIPPPDDPPPPPVVEPPPPAQIAELTEFAGPMTGWLNAKTGFGATGNGTTDDTTALRNWIAAMSSSTPVAYLPPGTYKLTGTISRTNFEHVTIIGHHPTLSKIVWGGAAGGKMFDFDGMRHSRICRINFAGGNCARILDISKQLNSFFDTGNEFADNIFEDADLQIAGGMRGYGFAENTILRNIFRRARQAAVFLGNSNALDIWARYNHFEQCARGLANYIPGGINGAGAYRGYDNVFLGSTVVDCEIGNTGLFSLRRNYSLGSRQFLRAVATGNPCQISLQGNIILDTSEEKAIDVQNQGPISAYDNRTRSKSGNTGVAWRVPDIISLSNQFTVATPISFINRSAVVDQSIVTRADINVSTPAFSGFEANATRTVREVAPQGTAAATLTAINNAINACVPGQRDIVHLKAGTYQIADSIVIPDGADLTLLGDGYGTKVVGNTPAVAGTPMLRIEGPTKATVREIMFDGNFKMPCVKCIGIDQVGARLILFGTKMDTAGTLFDGSNLDELVVEGFDIGHNLQLASSWGTSATGFKVRGGSGATKVNIWSGATSNQATSWNAASGAKLLVRDVWYEGTSHRFAIFTGSGTVTFESYRVACSPTFGQALDGYAIDITAMTGKVSLLGTTVSNDVRISGNCSGGKVLFGSGGTDYWFDRNRDGSYFRNVSSPAATANIWLCREWITSGGTASTANSSSTVDAQFIRDMYEHTRGEAPMETPEDEDVTDLRLFRVWMRQASGGHCLAFSDT